LPIVIVLAGRGACAVVHACVGAVLHDGVQGVLVLRGDAWGAWVLLGVEGGAAGGASACSSGLGVWFCVAAMGPGVGRSLCAAAFEAGVRCALQ
jgi:hypothetical protein